MSVAIVRSHDCDLDDVLSRSPEARTLPNATQLLRRWYRVSEEIWFGMHDDRIACICGLWPPSLISNRAYLWLLTTDLVEQHKFLFIRHSQRMIEDALKRYDKIIGHVEVGNDAGRKWLRWLGANIEPPANGFSKFTIRRR